MQGNRFILNTFMLILISSFFLFTAGYLFSETPKQPKVIKKETPEVVKKVKEEMPAYVYDSVEKRDPFRPPVFETKSKAPVSEKEGEVLEGLRKFNIDTLKLIGIISTKTENVAMVKAPDGKSYVLKKNTKVGPNGTVKEVNKDKVIIEEKYKVEEKNNLGKVSRKTVSNEIILSLEKKEGGNS